MNMMEKNIISVVMGAGASLLKNLKNTNLINHMGNLPHILQNFAFCKIL